MKKYNPEEFVEALSKKMGTPNIRSCPFCHGNKFTTTQQYAAIVIGEGLDGLTLGPNIPAGMIICENCGHMDFFALGALELLKKEESDDAKK